MNNQLVVESRETGKTAFLLGEVKRLADDGCTVIVLDSATDHEDKSLLRKVMATYPQSMLFSKF